MLQEPSSTRLLNPTLSKELGETGYNALIEFATRTYYAQINEEEKEFMRMSSLRVLGRLDVGVLYEPRVQVLRQRDSHPDENCAFLQCHGNGSGFIGD